MNMPTTETISSSYVEPYPIKALTGLMRDDLRQRHFDLAYLSFLTLFDALYQRGMQEVDIAEARDDLYALSTRARKEGSRDIANITAYYAHQLADLVHMNSTTENLGSQTEDPKELDVAGKVASILKSRLNGHRLDTRVFTAIVRHLSTQGPDYLRTMTNEDIVRSYEIMAALNGKSDPDMLAGILFNQLDGDPKKLEVLVSSANIH